MDEFEALLRQFQPRRPRPLPELAAPRRPRWFAAFVLPGLAAAVAVLVLIAARQEPASRLASPRLPTTLGALNAQGLTGARNLDTVLTTTSRAILPDVQRPGG